jgi:hypothetical protein
LPRRRDASSKKRVFEQAGLLFENHYGIARSAVYDALFARETDGLHFAFGAAITKTPRDEDPVHISKQRLRALLFDQIKVKLPTGNILLQHCNENNLYKKIYRQSLCQTVPCLVQ